MKRKTKSLVGLLSIAIVLLTSGVAMATITYEFYGNIIDINDTPGYFNPVVVGNSFTYGLIVNENVADTNPNPMFGHYEAITGMYLDIGGTRYAEANAGNIDIANNYNPYDAVSRDWFAPRINDSSYFTYNGFGAPILSSSVDMVQDVVNGEATIFDSDALPLFALDPAVFENRPGFTLYLYYLVQDPDDGEWKQENSYMEGRITGSAFSASVPEPATMFLLGSGLLGAGVYRRLRKPKG